MIFDAHSEIGNYTELDVACESCGHVTTIPRPDEDACERLIDGYYYNHAITEIELLKRAAAFFDAHPRSNHRYIILKKYRDRVPDPEPDSFLQSDVDSDPLLRQFLSRASFSFHDRQREVSGSIERLSDRLDAHQTACPKCGGAVRLTEECHEACGGCFSSEDAVARWAARRTKPSEQVSGGNGRERP